MQTDTKNNAMQIGVNCFEADILEDKKCLAHLTDQGLLDFAVCHIDAFHDSVDDGIKKAEKIASLFQSKQMDYIANFEFQNFLNDCVGPDGYDWANREDGTHLLRLPTEYIKALASKDNLASVMYDELEHVIINRNVSLELASKGKVKKPAFVLSRSRDTVTQGNLLDRQLVEYKKNICDAGAPNVCGEHVFPVLYHKFAKAGMIPNFKSQKESYSNVQFAIAAGAALQYGTPLWNCVDLWYRLKSPGHSSQEMFHNLLFAYYAGVNRVYVESCHRFCDKDDGNETWNAYGEAFERFAKTYKNHERAYTIADYRPEIGIIRYDDTFWGQCDPVAWKPMLFGNKDIKPDYRAKEYLKVFHLLTHGETCKNGLTWSRISPWSLHRHRSFASLNSTAVFDDVVRKETLQSLKLCFLCGYRISKETLADVRTLVQENSLTVVTTKRFAPVEIAKQAKGALTQVMDGAGRWIIVRNFEENALQEMIKPYLGQKGQMRLTFKNAEVVMDISKDGETFTVKE